MLGSLFVALTLTQLPEAQEAFRRGRELLQQGRVAEACASFEESHRRDPALGALLNWAECNVQLENYPTAFALYQEALVWSQRNKNEARAAVAQQRLDALRPRIGILLVDAPGTEVRVDRQLKVAGQAVPVEPGAHVVELKRPDGSSETRTVSVKAGESRSVPLHLALEAPRAEERINHPRPVVAAAPSSFPKGPLGFMVAGCVVLAAAVGVWAWSVDIWNRGEAQRQGGPLTVTREQYESASAVYPWSIVGVGAGAAAGLTGLLWWLLGKNDGTTKQ